MASGDIVLQVTGAMVTSDNTSLTTTTIIGTQETTLVGGTTSVPAPIVLPYPQGNDPRVPIFATATVKTTTSYPSGSSFPVALAETVFNSTKKYMITITEV